MKPLLFLTGKSIVNGVKRAVTSPRRLIGFLVIVAYYAQFVVRSVMRSNSYGPGSARTVGFEYQEERVQAFAFFLFAVISLVLFLTSMTPKGGFRPADVDVLFPTPINPKIVLIFRILRDSIASMVIPIFFAIVAGGSAQRLLVMLRHMPNKGAVGQTFSLAYILMALAWISIGYAISLFTNRSDHQSEKNKKLIDWGAGVLITVSIAYIAWRMQSDLSWDTFVELSQNFGLRILFFTASAAKMMLAGAIDGSPLSGAVGFLTLVGTIAIALKLAMSQVEYLYDQAAAKGFKSQDMNRLQRSGDLYGVVAERARQGKLKRSRLAGWISRQRWRGHFAIIWKEMLLQARGGAAQHILIGLLTLTMVLLPISVGRGEKFDQAIGGIFLAMLGFAVFISANTTATTGFIELLRRGDFQKPLPFSPTTLVFWEVAAKTIPIVFIGLTAAIGATILDSRLLGVALGGLLMAPTFGLVLTSVSLVIVLLFPDIEDATQRGFRGLMMLLGSVIAALPGMGIAIGLYLLGIHPLIIAIPFGGLNVVAAVGLSFISGGLYGSFNPSE